MREVRTLPVVAAGAVEMPFGILGYDEVVACDTTWDEHSHAFHELLWNERGASTAVVGARVWTITPSLGLWMPAGTLHSGSAVAGTWFRAGFFGFHTTPSISDVPVTVEITPLLRLLLERSRTEDLTPPARERTDAVILDLLAPSPRELMLTVPDHPLLAPVVAALMADTSDPTTLEEWARRIGVSSRTLARAFEASTGVGFRTWVTTARSHHAVALLAEGQRVEDVAVQVGFRSASAFTAAFRRVTGVTPGEFRQAPAAPEPVDRRAGMPVRAS